MQDHTYGHRVMQLREEQGLTREEFAERIGVPLRTLQDIELDKVQRPQRKTREKIDAALGANPAADTIAGWPPEIKTFLRLIGAYLVARSEEQQEAFMEEVMRWIAANR